MLRCCSIWRMGRCSDQQSRGRSLICSLVSVLNPLYAADSAVGQDRCVISENWVLLKAVGETAAMGRLRGMVAGWRRPWIRSAFCSWRSPDGQGTPWPRGEEVGQLGVGQTGGIEVIWTILIAWLVLISLFCAFISGGDLSFKRSIENNIVISIMLPKTQSLPGVSISQHFGF
jgi:hypothetical protein